MKSKELFRTAMELMEQETNFVLAAITESSGSAPRKAGAKMLILPSGKTYGTVGGGSIEYAASQVHLRVLLNNRKILHKGIRFKQQQSG